MTDTLFPRNDNENSPIPDRPARAKRKRGVGGGGFEGSTPVSNTGVTDTIPPINIHMEVTSEIPQKMLELQGDSIHGSGYRFLSAPNGIDRMEWEMEYRTVIPLDTANPSAAAVDWLHIVFKWGDKQIDIDNMDRVLLDVLGFGINSEQPVGRFNYARQFILQDDKCRFFVGGSYQRGTAMLSFPGSAMQFMDYEKIRCLGENILKGWITRVDLCVDFYNGEYTVDKAMHDYKSGLYSLSCRQPYHRYVGPIEGEINPHGRTLYIGKRKNGKLLRVYEKGKKQGITKGLFVDWTRVELELHGSNPNVKNRRLIPWDILIRPGSYLAGGYKALEFIHESFDRIKAVAIKTASSLKKSVDHIRKVGGKPVNALLHMGMNHFSIVEMIRGEGLPVYYNPKEFEEYGISVDEMREWCLKTFGCEQEFLLVPKL